MAQQGADILAHVGLVVDDQHAPAGELGRDLELGVDVVGHRATVRLTPRWFARLLTVTQLAASRDEMFARVSSRVELVTPWKGNHGRAVADRVRWPARCGACDG